MDSIKKQEIKEIIKRIVIGLFSPVICVGLLVGLFLGIFFVGAPEIIIDLWHDIKKNGFGG